uniref:Uncharacterized protein n=1 Tax=Kryptolebias marmoratus TaxID=37003 RepID=A0A3Q3BJT1_KRYMA
MDHQNCAEWTDGKEKLHVETKVTNSASMCSTSRHSPFAPPSVRSLQVNKKDRRHNVTKVSARYQQPTVSSSTRSLSPYTHRKMCQLSEDTRQRLGHLQLGPHRFRKETESQPPFLVEIDFYFSFCLVKNLILVRFQTSPPYWEQIHDRVQRILQTHKTSWTH